MERLVVEALEQLLIGRLQVSLSKPAVGFLQLGVMVEQGAHLGS